MPNSVAGIHIYIYYTRLARPKTSIKNLVVAQVGRGTVVYNCIYICIST